MTERDITRQVRDLLRTLGAYELKWLGGLGSPKGVPDIIFCYLGRFGALEVKAPKGRLTVAQEMQIALIRRAGGLAAVVRSLEEAVDALAEIDPEIWERVRVTA